MEAMTGSDQFLIRGEVLYLGGESARDLVVRAFDKDQDKENVVGGAFTSSDGTYLIKYSSARFVRPDKKRADIIVRVYNFENEVLAQSEVIKEAPPDLTVVLVVMPSIEYLPALLPESIRLHAGMHGQEVNLLHAILRRLGYYIPAEELKQSLYGKGTQDVLNKFQLMHNLPQSGNLDIATIKMINDALVRGEIQTLNFTISGTVRYEGTADLAAGLIVRAFERYQGSRTLLGEAKIDDSSKYRIEYSPGKLEKPDKMRPGLSIQVFSGETIMAGAEVINAPANVNVDLLMPEKSPDHFIIIGTVRSDIPGADMSGFIVTAHENYNGIENPLGYDDLDRSGGYRIEYNPDKLRNPDKKHLNLVVRAYRPMADAMSDNVSGDAIMDIKISVRS